VLKSEWIERFPGKNADGMVEFLNNFNLGMEWGKKGKTYWVATGEKVLLETTEEETAEAFLLGMALAYLALPEDVRDTLQDRFAT
jgi:hypothetical protein